MPVNEPGGALWLALKLKRGEANHGASFTFVTLMMHVVLDKSGAPSMPASVTRTCNTKLDVAS